jgi:hypothetical protein
LADGRAAPLNDCASACAPLCHTGTEVGLSDIFHTITLSADHRTITYSDGLIPVGDRFTDFIFSMTDDGGPFKVGVFTSFDGFLDVPEPPSWTILLIGFVAAGVLRRRILRPGS